MNRITKSKTRRAVTTGIVGLALLGLVPLTAQAWGRGGRGEPSPERAAARLTERLDLTAEQQEQVKGVLEESFARRAEVRAAHREEMDALRDQTHEKLAAILTAEQVEKLDQLRELRQERMERRRDCVGRPGRGNGGPADD